MRLKTKLVLSATALTFAIVLVMSTIFVGELLRQRVEQTTSATEVLAHQVVLVTLQALQTGMRVNPPVDRSEDALKSSVTSALRQNADLLQLMNSIVRYSPTVQDVRVTDTAGVTLVSTDPDAQGQRLAERAGLGRVKEQNFWSQTRELFGQPRVLDLSESIQRNGKPFLSVHLGVRSTFLRASYEPWLRTALVFAAMAGLTSMLAAALLANLALSPIEQISKQLEHLGMAETPAATTKDDPVRTKPDTVVRVTRSIDRLGEQMRSTEAGYTALRTNLDKMLDTLRDGVLLFTEDGRAAMVSDAAAHFLDKPESELVGSAVGQIFDESTVLGASILRAFDAGRTVTGESLTLEDGREVQFSLDRIHDGSGTGQAMGTLVTLRDVESAAQLEQELEVSRRLAAVGRLTAGVGHEVKNPINAMVVHLELLKSKLANVTDGGAMNGAQRHVEILAGEMQRLDRVVQTLADFSRPMELHLADRDLRDVVAAVVELTGAEMLENGVRVLTDVPREPVVARVDAELMQQALLNLVLNGMQAMPEGGRMRIAMRREHHFAVVQVVDAGEGIPEEVLPRIFDLYFTTKAKGSGIGLAMTYRILQMHGGAMEVRSSTDVGSPERGTAFTIRLPIVSGAGDLRRSAAVAGRSNRGVGEQV